MRKVLVVILIVVAVLVWFPGLRGKISSYISNVGGGLTRPPAEAPAPTGPAAKVYVIRDGPYYHLANCPSLVGKVAVPTPLAEAKELFQPCPVCKPPH